MVSWSRCLVCECIFNRLGIFWSNLCLSSNQVGGKSHSENPDRSSQCSSSGPPLARPVMVRTQQWQIAQGPTLVSTQGRGSSNEHSTPPGLQHQEHSTSGCSILQSSLNRHNLPRTVLRHVMNSWRPKTKRCLSQTLAHVLCRERF